MIRRGTWLCQRSGHRYRAVWPALAQCDECLHIVVEAAPIRYEPPPTEPDAEETPQ